MSGDTIWMEVLPSLANFGKKLSDETDKAAKGSGKTAGGAWSQAFSQSAGDSGSKALVAELEANEQRAQKAVQAATQSLMDDGTWGRILDAWGVEDAALTTAELNPKT